MGRTTRRAAQHADLTGLLTEHEPGAWLRGLQNRAWARSMRNEPLTPQDRLRGFAQTGFTPHGLYEPAARDQADVLDARLKAIGLGPDKDDRREQYLTLQDETAQWEADGVVGQWSGQQALARSQARFRLAGWGRRGGKTFYAANEAVAVALQRPRSTIWCAAPIMRHVSRCFDMVWEIIADLHIPCVMQRNGPQEKFLQLENGSRIEGMSLENVFATAGASVNLAIVDEAAQILPEAWFRGIMPPLADCMGQSLLLSSWEGAEGFFYEQARKAEEQGLAEWEVFYGVSWVNFFMFERGEESEAIQQAKRITPPVDFIEQYGAVPAQARNLVYPQFKTAIHVGDWPFNPDLEVTLAVDPSKGANEYAVVAVQSDPDTGLNWVFDEYYAVGAMAEDVTAALNTRPWRWAVTNVVIDNADPNEILRWNQAGFPAFAVEDKPSPEVRYPILRRLLRDPVLYLPYHERKLLETLAKSGVTIEEFRHFRPDEQHTILIDLEQSLSDLHFTPADLAELRQCARLFINRATCPATVNEFLQYVYQKRRQLNISPSERGRKFRDHLMDALGYWSWVFKRDEYLRAQEVEGQLNIMGLTYDYAQPLVPGPLPRLPAYALAQAEPRILVPEGGAARQRRFTQVARDHYTHQPSGSYVEWDDE